MSERKGRVDVDAMIAQHSPQPGRSRARLDAEMKAAALFAKPKLGLPDPRIAPETPPISNMSAPDIAAEAFHQIPLVPQAVASSDPVFVAAVQKSLDRLHVDLSVLSQHFANMTEQLARMAALQSQAASDTAEQKQLSKQNIEAVARLAPIVHQAQTTIASSVREAISSLQSRDGVAPAGAAIVQAAEPVPETATHSTASMAAGTAPTLSAEVAAPDRPKRPRRTKAEMEVARAEEARRASLGLKRGRGRPRKNPVEAVPAQEEGAATPAKTGAKRPAVKAVVAKAFVGMTSPVAPPMAGSPVRRGRGRPRKVPVEAAVAPPVSAVSEEAPGVAVKRGRGRPPKALTAAAKAEQVAQPVARANEGEAVAQASISAPVKRGRGRPRKDAATAALVGGRAYESVAKLKAAAPIPVTVEVPVKRGRGRPRKSHLATVPVGS